MYIYIYIYIYILWRIGTLSQGPKRGPGVSAPCGPRGPLLDPDNTPSPPTKSLGFRGFDSSKLLVLKGGNSHVLIIL